MAPRTTTQQRLTTLWRMSLRSTQCRRFHRRRRIRFTPLSHTRSRYCRSASHIISHSSHSVPSCRGRPFMTPSPSFPIGYKVIYSIELPLPNELYVVFEIVDVNDSPNFVLTFVGYTMDVIRCSSMSEAYTKMCSFLAFEWKTQSGSMLMAIVDDRSPSDELRAYEPHFFGLYLPLVRYLIQRLPLADQCRGVVHLDFENISIVEFKPTNFVTTEHPNNPVRDPQLRWDGNAALFNAIEAVQSKVSAKKRTAERRKHSFRQKIRKSKSDDEDSDDRRRAYNAQRQRAYRSAKRQRAERERSATPSSTSSSDSGDDSADSNHSASTDSPRKTPANKDKNKIKRRQQDERHVGSCQWRPQRHVFHSRTHLR